MSCNYHIENCAVKNLISTLKRTKNNTMIVTSLTCFVGNAFFFAFFFIVLYKKRFANIDISIVQKYFLWYILTIYSISFTLKA